MNSPLAKTLSVLAIVLAASIGSGCHGLAPGKMEWVQTASDAPRAGNAYLLRGWIGVFSTGVDELSQKLNERGVRAHVYQELQAGALADTIAKKYLGDGEAEPLVLIGHSYGADNVVRVARALEKKGVSVDLMVTLDPTTPPSVPKNVKLAYNYYQPQPLDVIPLFRGIPLKQDEGGSGKLVNYNLRSDRKDLLAPDTNHINIDKNPKVHDAVVQNVLEVCPERSQWTAQRGGANGRGSAAGHADPAGGSAGGGR